MRLRLAVLDVAYLALLAGCNGLGFGPAAPATTQTTSGTTAQQTPFPPGLTAVGSTTVERRRGIRAQRTTFPTTPSERR